MKVNMHEAKSRLSELGQQVLAGERVIIARAGEPWLELVPYRPGQSGRRPGAFKDRIRLAEDFDAPLPEFERLFTGEGA